MTHIVIHDDRDGVTRYHQFDDVRDAAGFLEMLYDTQGIDGAHLYALHEVDFAVKSYVKVEIGGTEVTTPTEAPAAPKGRTAPAGRTAPESRTAPADRTAPEAKTPEVPATPEAKAPEADEPELISMDDVEYVEASMAAPEPVVSEPVEVAGSSEPRRGLFGR